MINLRELRLGNIVSVNGRPDIVTEIGQADNGYCSGTGYFNADKAYIEPIPLTPEWLERMGFENIPKGSVCYRGPFQICNYNEDGVFCFDHGDRQAHIRYVHQLQNLYFAMTGEELTIKEQTGLDKNAPTGKV